MHKNENTQNSHSFLAVAFFKGICLSRHQRIWNQHKILRFFIPITIFFKKKNFWVIIALFGFLKCKCEKNFTFSNILQKVKSNFFANIYHSPSDSYWNSKKSLKLKPPTMQWWQALCRRSLWERLQGKKGQKSYAESWTGIGSLRPAIKLTKVRGREVSFPSLTQKTNACWNCAVKETS